MPLFRCLLFLIAGTKLESLTTKQDHDGARRSAGQRLQDNVGFVSLSGHVKPCQGGEIIKVRDTSTNGVGLKASLSVLPTPR